MQSGKTGPFKDYGNESCDLQVPIEANYYRRLWVNWDGRVLLELGKIRTSTISTYNNYCRTMGGWEHEETTTTQQIEPVVEENKGVA